MPKTLPTERLTQVVAEALNIQTSLKSFHTTVAQVVRDWGTMPEEARLASLREALDQLVPNTNYNILEAAAYLRTNGGKIRRARNAQRKGRGLPPNDYTPELPRPEGTPLVDTRPTFSLADIEEKLQELGEASNA